MFGRIMEILRGVQAGKSIGILFFSIFLVTLILALVSAGILSVIYVILVIVPSVAVAVRRLHDVGKSGWMLLAGLVPIIGSLYLLYLFCLDSNDAGDEYDSSAPYFPYDD